jgi:hypothetical protein
MANRYPHKLELKLNSGGFKPDEIGRPPRKADNLLFAFWNEYLTLSMHS